MSPIERSLKAAAQHLSSATSVVNDQREDLSSVDSQMVHNAANQAMEAARELYRLAGYLEARKEEK